MKYERPSAPIDQIEETPRRKPFEVDPKDIEALKRKRHSRIRTLTTNQDSNRDIKRAK